VSSHAYLFGVGGIGRRFVLSDLRGEREREREKEINKQTNNTFHSRSAYKNEPIVWFGLEERINMFDRFDDLGGRV
jgi:hypothetical protein